MLAIDPSGVPGWRRWRLAASPIPVEFVGLDGQKIDLPDDSADCALSTWTLCTIPDAVAALRELRRIVRPGGELFFLEHGRSPRPNVEKWQHRLDPIQRRVAGGCNLSRDISGLIAEAGFDIERVVEFDIDGPKVMSHMFSGRPQPGLTSPTARDRRIGPNGVTDPGSFPANRTRGARVRSRWRSRRTACRHGREPMQLGMVVWDGWGRTSCEG